MNKKILFIFSFFLIIFFILFILINNKEEKEISDKNNTFCTEEIKPVCGDDNQTYINTCKALESGVSIKKNVSCESTISEEFVKNATYYIIEYEKYVKLNDGIFSQKIDNELFTTKIFENKYVFGNIDDDDAEDIAVILLTTYKGYQNLELAIILNDTSDPIYWTSISLENINTINHLSIKDKIITLNLEKYKLEGTKLIKQ